MKYEDILKHIGVLGKYQKLLIFATAMIQFPTASQFLGQVFLAPNVDHWCAVRGSLAINCSQLDSVAECQEEQKLESIPFLKVGTDGNMTFSSCERKVVDTEDSGSGQDSNITETIPCDAGWDFDRSRYKSSINEDFELVCDREDYPGIAQSIWFAGLLVGSLLWGSVGDWIGRRNTFRICLVIASVSSIVTTFAPSFAAFTVMRFITAAAGYGIYLITFVLASEIIGPKQRAKVGTLFNMFFSFGYIFLSGMAFLLRDWRHLQLGVSLPFLLFAPLILLFPESPRWLISKGKFKEAKQVLEKISKVNGTTVPENIYDDGEKEKPRVRVTQVDLVRTFNIRKITLIMGLNWFVVNMVYYGLSLSTSGLGIDDYVAALVAAATEIPSLLIGYYVMERFGRRLTLSAFYVSGGVFCLITIFLPYGPWRAAVAMLGKCAITAAFNHVYIYSCELYPTVIRSMGVGVCSMVARVSGILCPFILILAKYWDPLPLCVFGGSSLIAGIFTLMLPETLGRNLPDTIAEGEQFAGGSDYEGEVESTKNYLPLSTSDKNSAIEV